jgi:hypothetical protein
VNRLFDASNAGNRFDDGVLAQSNASSSTALDTLQFIERFMRRVEKTYGS